MKTRDVAKVTVIAGWAAGIALILAAIPFLLAVAAFALTVAAAVAVDRCAAAGMTWVKARAGRVLERRVKTGRAVERA